MNNSPYCVQHLTVPDCQILGQKALSTGENIPFTPQIQVDITIFTDCINLKHSPLMLQVILPCYRFNIHLLRNKINLGVITQDHLLQMWLSTRIYRAGRWKKPLHLNLRSSVSCFLTQKMYFVHCQARISHKMCFHWQNLVQRSTI